MRDGRTPRSHQMVNLLEICRYLICSLNLHVCDIFSTDDIKRQNRLKRVFQDASFYIIVWHMTKSKFYEISFCPMERLRECCYYLLLSKEVEDPEAYLNEEILLKILKEIDQVLEGRLDRGDQYDLFDYILHRSSVMAINYKGDYRILVYEHLASHDEQFNTEIVVGINEDNTLLEEYRKRDQRALQETRRYRRVQRLSF